MTTRRTWLALLLALAACLAVAAPALAATPSLVDASGLHVVNQATLDSRLLTTTVTTSALPGPANIRILLPAGYDPSSARRYPVLYLLHGTSGGADDWTKMGDAERTTAGLPLIVVMPDIGLNRDGGGWCTNWFNGGARGQPEWETFHVDQLIPWVDRNLRTLAARGGRAIAGLSQGGFCSMSYAARHPDLFADALSYSGAPDTTYDPAAQALVTPIIQGTAAGLDHAPPDAMFGPRLTQQINWAGHDPTTLAPNLRGMRLSVFTGNGAPGPLDSTSPNPEASVIEAGVHTLTQLFHARLNALGIPSFYDDYGPGTHTWPYWARDLRESIGSIMTTFAHPPPAPAAITYTSAEPAYSVYGWHVTMHRAAMEFSTLTDARATGFSLAGSGSATVVTPAAYRAGARYRVTVRSGSGASAQTLAADAAGRLHVEVPLGPANPNQQYTAAAALTGTRVFTTTVAVGAGTSAPPAGARSRIHLRVRPSRVRAGRRVRYVLTATAPLRGHLRPLRGARVRFAGRTRHTDARGRVTLIARLRKPGHATATARRAGYRTGVAHVRVLPARPRRSQAPRFTG